MADKWTEEEVTTLAGMKRAGLSAKIIAARLGRTEHAVAVKSKQIKSYQKLSHKGGGVSKSGAVQIYNKLFSKMDQEF